MSDYKVDEERGILTLSSGEELYIVPDKLDISIDEFFDDDKPEWVKQLQTEIESLKAITELALKENAELKGDIQRIFERADEAFADQPDNYALSIALTMIRKWSHERLNPKDVDPNAQT